MNEQNRSGRLKLMATACLLVVTLHGTVSLSGERIPPEAYWHPREVGQGELKEKRGETEDRIRTEILGAFSADDQRLGKLQDVLNGPWDRDAVEYLGNLILTNAPSDQEATITCHQWKAITDMLVHLAQSAAQRPLADQARQELDKAFARAAPFFYTKAFGGNVFQGTAMSVAEYGSADLLTESFWKGLEQGLWAPRVLESVGDTAVLNRLRDMWTRNVWPAGAPFRELARRTIAVVELQLSYPELKGIRNRTTRLYLGQKLQSMKEPKTDAIAKLLNETKDGETRKVLEAISGRLAADGGVPRK